MITMSLFFIWHDTLVRQHHSSSQRHCYIIDNYIEYRIRIIISSSINTLSFCVFIIRKVIFSQLISRYLMCYMYITQYLQLTNVNGHSRLHSVHKCTNVNTVVFYREFCSFMFSCELTSATVMQYVSTRASIIKFFHDYFCLSIISIFWPNMAIPSKDYIIRKHWENCITEIFYSQ